MSKKHFLRGLRDGIPIGLGYFAVSFGIGISAHNAHLSIFQGFLLSFLNNASSGEYGGITIIAADSGLWAMALMMLVVNARYLLMSCALSQRLSPDTPLPWRLLIAYDLTDEIFGLAIAQPGYLEVWYYFGTMCAAMPGWSIGTVLGVLMGNLMPVWAVSGCSVMLFGMFLAIIIPVGKQNRIVLGCTHYPFLAEVIADEAGAAIEIIDPAPAIARRTASLLDRHGLRAERGHVPVYTFLSAAGVPYAERLRERASRL